MNQTNQKYLAAFVELYGELQTNPKVHVSDIANKHKIGKHPFSMLVQMGIVSRTKSGMTWIGKEPSIQMVIQIRLAIRQYHIELDNKKKVQGELFKRSNPNMRIRKETHIEWEQRVKQQKPETTDIPIKQPLPDSSMISEFITHEYVETKKLNWFQRVMKAIFNL
jgi:hypothetical protein